MAGMILLRGPSTTGALDPDSATPQGSMAIANLLENRGVAVNRVRTLAEATNPAANSTLIIINSPLIGTPAADRLLETSTERTVIVGFAGGVTDSLVQEVHQNQPAELAAQCTLPEAARAGRATFAGQLVSGSGSSCFPGAAGSGLLYEGNHYLLADGLSLQNQHLAEAGNAALSINLLSTTESVTWYLPSPSDIELAAGSPQGISDLLPEWSMLVLFQALLLFTVLAVWRGRRLGPLISEDLPVVVPSHETDQGYASLLQRNTSASHAAAALRRATVSRLALVCGLPAHASAAQVSYAIAGRLHEPESRVAAILHKRPIESDAQLVELQAQLAQLERSAHPERKAPNP
jgi:hypothetical protein